MHKIIDADKKVVAGPTTWRQEGSKAVALVTRRKVKQFQSANKAVLFERVNLVFPDTDIENLTADLREYVIRAAMVELQARARAKKDKQFRFALEDIAQWDNIDMSQQGLIEMFGRTTRKVGIPAELKAARALIPGFDKLDPEKRKAILAKLEAMNS